MPSLQLPTDPDCPLLRLDQVSHQFDRRPVLDGVQMALAAGEVLVVTGPNGSGKSTLLRIAAGLLKPASGRVERGTGGIGYLAPDLQPWSELSARENLDFLARIRGCREASRDSIEWLIEAGFPAADLQSPSATLSTGQRQRLKLAMARLGLPGLMILDEPGSNLDEAGRWLVAQLVGEAKTRGAVLLATNDAAESALGTRQLALRIMG